MYGKHCTVYSSHCTVYGLHIKVYRVECTVDICHCKLSSVHYIHSIQYSVWPKQCGLFCASRQTSIGSDTARPANPSHDREMRQLRVFVLLQSVKKEYVLQFKIED